jgi:hypothetical protein
MLQKYYFFHVYKVMVSLYPEQETISINGQVVTISYYFFDQHNLIFSFFSFCFFSFLFFFDISYIPQYGIVYSVRIQDWPFDQVENELTITLLSQVRF